MSSDSPSRAINDLLRRRHGLATRQELLAVAPRSIVDDHIDDGRLRRVFPHVYTGRGNPAAGDRRLRAALLCVGEPAALSHTTALAVRGLREHAGPIHVTIDQGRRHAGAQGLVVHRRLDLAGVPTEMVRGLPAMPLEESLVEAWAVLPRADRRPTLIDAVRDTGLELKDLVQAAQRRPNIGGHRDLAVVIDLIADGVRSELEAMGVLAVFEHRSLPRSRGQVAVDCPDGIRRRLDRGWGEAMLGVELDGAAFHTSPKARQEDLERDAMFAACGWLVLRFTYAEVLRDPEGVRRKVLAVYRTRLAQLGAA